MMDTVLYCASHENQTRMERLHSLKAVKTALAYLEEDQENSILEQIAIAETEAPTYFESKRAELYAEKLKELGVQNVVIRSDGNVEGIIPGTESGTILMEGHLDTVFSFGTVKSIRRKDGVLYGPGIYDNARGLSSILAMLRALRMSGLKLRKSVIIAGTVEEENPGGLAGMKRLLDAHPEIEASINVDGGFIQGITYNATYGRNVSYTFHGTGGHASGAFGLCANALSAASRAVAKMSTIIVPDEPRTTFAATRMLTPLNCATTAIPSECTLYVDYRSTDPVEFDKLGQQLDACVQSGCEEETRFWAKDEITFDKEIISETPGGKQDIHSPLVEAHYLAGKSLGLEPFFRPGGSCNGNVAISRGIPCVTAGAGEGNRKGHSLNEFFPEEDAYRFPQGLLLLLLMAAGVDGAITSCID